MRIGMVGLGRMGANMVRRLLRGGHEVVAFDLSEEARAEVAKDGAEAAGSLEDLVAKLSAPRVVWSMLPAGAPTAETVLRLRDLLEEGDVVVEGGNSYFRDSIEQAKQLSERGVRFVDAGVSGGIWGLTEGYCLMVGGEPDAVSLVEPAFVTLAPTGGYAHVGPVGAGHFVKMVHNGIEYGMMQAYAEGFELLSKAPGYNFDLHEIAAIWRYGSVVRSWLLELIERALRPESGFEHIRGVVQDSGEGRWTVKEAVDAAVPLPVISAALYARFASRDPDSLANRLLAAQRNQFGGHPVVTDGEGAK